MRAEGAPTQVAVGFEGFYRREYAALERVLAGMTGRWGVAEELAQEAHVAAYRNWDRVQALDRARPLGPPGGGAPARSRPIGGSWPRSRRSGGSAAGRVCRKGPR